MSSHCPPRCSHLHFSTLKNFARSPAHYKYASEHGTVTTPAMAVGSAVHALCLEHGDGIVRFEGSRRGKEWTAFQEAHSRGAGLHGPHRLDPPRRCDRGTQDRSRRESAWVPARS